MTDTAVAFAPSIPLNLVTSPHNTVISCPSSRPKIIACASASSDEPAPNQTPSPTPLAPWPLLRSGVATAWDAASAFLLPQRTSEEKDANNSGNGNPQSPEDSDGIEARIAARMEADDGIAARIEARRRADMAAAQQVHLEEYTIPTPMQHEQHSHEKEDEEAGNGGPFFFFGRRSSTSGGTAGKTRAEEKPRVKERKKPRRKNGSGGGGDVFRLNGDSGYKSATISQRCFGGMHEQRIYAYVSEALSRQASLPSAEKDVVMSVMPYDVQRALFEELRSGAPTQEFRRKLDTLQTGRRDTDIDTDDKTTQSESSPLPLPLRVIGDVLRAVSSLRGDNTVARAEKEARKKKAAAAAYAAALTRDMHAAGETGGGAGAAAAFAAAEAIARSSTNTRLDAIEEAGLAASVAAARAVGSVEDARVFVESVGVTPLVSAARMLEGSVRSSALTALANIAIMLPKCRLDMLQADNGSIVNSLAKTIGAPGGFAGPAARENMLCRTEALVSGTHLLGSLALADGHLGREWRSRMATNAHLIRSLRRLAGGLKNGEPEGAARAARRALGTLGVNEWHPRVPGQRGLRILSIDGGGTRAIMAFEMLKHLKRVTGCEIHEMFDVIGGTSTGAIVAASLGMAHKTVEQVELLYRDMIGKIFAKHPVNGPKMLLTRAYYDTRVLETTLKRECGTGVFIDSLAEENMNKVFVVSSIMSRSPQELHVFRNYTYPQGHESRYTGTVEAQLWEALRASSAAPTFFSEIRVNGELHADGAIVANNPAAVALHETRCMYPGVPIELLVSMGNGQSPADANAADTTTKEKNVGWGDVVGSIVASATSTESVHHALLDLFPSDKYFRFNPVTDSTQIDETRPDQLKLFVKDSRDYINANSERFETVARILRPKTPRKLWRRFRDALQEEIQVLQTSIEDDLYLPNKPEFPR